MQGRLTPMVMKEKSGERIYVLYIILEESNRNQMEEEISKDSE